MDLAVWWRERRWLALLELIDQLPFASRVTEAVWNDPEQAALIAQAPKGDGAWSPRVQEFDLTASQLRELINGQQMLLHAIVRGNGGKPGKFVPYPAPVTEVDRQQVIAERRWAERMIQIFTPNV